MRARLAEFTRTRLTAIEVLVPYAQGALVSAIYAVGRDVVQEAGLDGTLVRALVPPTDAARINAALNGG